MVASAIPAPGVQDTPQFFSFVDHPQSDELFAQLARIEEHHRLSGEALGLRLVGPSESGKTEMLKEFARRERASNRNLNRHAILYVPLPEKAKLRDVYTGILLALGDPLYNKGTEPQLRTRAEHLCKRLGVIFIFLDEIHHLSDERSNGIRTAAVQMSKNLISRGICVVLSGTKDITELVALTDELRRRFRMRVGVDCYQLGKRFQQAQFRLFLDDLGSTLPKMGAVSFGTDDDWFIRMSVASGGLAGRVVALVKQTTTYVLSEGRDELTKKDFSHIWSSEFSSTQEMSLQYLRTSKKHNGALFNAFDADIEKVKEIFSHLINVSA